MERTKCIITLPSQNYEELQKWCERWLKLYFIFWCPFWTCSPYSIIFPVIAFWNKSINCTSNLVLIPSFWFQAQNNYSRWAYKSLRIIMVFMLNIWRPTTKRKNSCASINSEDCLCKRCEEICWKGYYSSVFQTYQNDRKWLNISPFKWVSLFSRVHRCSALSDLLAFKYFA